MEQIAFGETGRSTTRLGFGCSSLMGAMSRRESLAVLDWAYDAGIRHFDVAPMYGYGEAESCLGEFLQGHRSQVTVTSKYGILPPKNTSLLSAARRFAVPLVKKLPGFKERIARTAKAVTRTAEKASFTPGQAKASLERSLAALRTGHIDLWLLHDVSVADLNDDSLLSFLDEEVQRGRIGSFGVGSGGAEISDLLVERAAYCRVVQYEWSVLKGERKLEGALTGTAFRIHHRSLANAFRMLGDALNNDKERCRRWSDSTKTDLGDPRGLARLMLKAAFVMNPGSVVLFSSKNPRHIQTNVDVADDPSLEAPAKELYRLAQAEREQLFASGRGQARYPYL
ncbi:aldo/keto reductase [Granulicella sp. S190]|uniref:aldo/keto reductase n=1 Tax=Granulicella sp. S190 TaxID=1747226 RepID=UPI00131D1067|nr:aldo/keto reductase [Granulicella sp. S190]